MIVVLGSDLDAEAVDLVSEWRHVPARLVTPRDLSQAGWSLYSSGEPGGFVAGGERLRTDDVTGVLVRLPVVRPCDLVTIVEADREYAAAEMTAFLAAWLTSQKCRLINRPSPAYLAGPAWSAEEWLIRAAQLGIPTVDVVRLSSSANGTTPIDRWVTFVGGRVFDALSPGDGDAVRALAQFAGVDLVRVGIQVDGGTQAVAAVDLIPPMASREIRGALLALLGGAMK